MDDHRVILIEIGRSNGFKYDPATNNWSPEPTARWNALNQEDDFVSIGAIMPAMIAFYVMSALWLISYLQLICTDITSHNYPD